MAVVFANVYFSNSLEMTANRRTTVSLETTLLEGQTDKSTVPLPMYIHLKGKKVRTVSF